MTNKLVDVRKFLKISLMQKMRIGQRWPHAKFRRNRTIFDRVMTKNAENICKIWAKFYYYFPHF